MLYENWTVAFFLSMVSVVIVQKSRILLQNEKITVQLILNIELRMNICRSSLFNQKHKVGWFLLRGFADLVRVCSLHIIGRNHSNTFSLINLLKAKNCPKYNIAAKAIFSDIGYLSEEFSFAATCLEEEQNRKIYFFSSK